jgi:hypothetical protein
MKLDAKFYGEVRKVKDDSRVPEDEWCAFLAKDNAFALTLPVYRSFCVAFGADSEQIASVDRMIARVEAWRAETPDAAGEKLLA